jgi:histidinol-phosphate aminotransferase
LVKVNDANTIYQQLIDRKLIVRNRNNQLKNCLRITIGSPEENKKLINELKNLDNAESTIYR